LYNKFSLAFFFTQNGEKDAVETPFCTFLHLFCAAFSDDLSFESYVLVAFSRFCDVFGRFLFRIYFCFSFSCVFQIKRMGWGILCFYYTRLRANRAKELRAVGMYSASD